jgi:asparagine N-glycosylation enzyme membrane subunit Stt3
LTVLFVLFGIFIPMLFVDTASTWLVWALPALMLVFFLFAASVAVAILRHHLYDIDRLLSRTLTYGALTLVLGIVYAGAVVMLGQVLNFRGGDSSLAVAASTLLVAGLFQPLRRRVQDSVDRRFNRRRYDTAQMIAIFSARLRDEVDLDTLRAELLTVSTRRCSRRRRPCGFDLPIARPRTKAMKLVLLGEGSWCIDGLEP